VFERVGLAIDDLLPGLEVTVAEAVLAPHRCYLPEFRPLLRHRSLRALAHITGGGISDNLPRVLPRGTSAEVNLDSFRLPPLFRLLADAGRIAEVEMLRTFNCGVGLIAVVAARDEQAILGTLSSAFRLGEVTASANPPRVRYQGHLQ